ncbi:MAG: hypothetical protein ACRCTJ_02080 [Brevinema sp.]
MNKMLLYIENKLPLDQMNEYSSFLKNNPDEMKKVVQLSKALAIYDAQHSRIHTMEIVDKPSSYLDFMLTGLIDLIDRKKLAFRGSHDVIIDSFCFLKLTLQVIKKKEQGLELIITSAENLWCEWMDLATGNTDIITLGEAVPIIADQRYLLRYDDEGYSELLFISF